MKADIAITAVRDSSILSSHSTHHEIHAQPPNSDRRFQDLRNTRQHLDLHQHERGGNEPENVGTRCRRLSSDAVALSRPYIRGVVADRHASRDIRSLVCRSEGMSGTEDGAGGICRGDHDDLQAVHRRSSRGEGRDFGGCAGEVARVHARLTAEADIANEQAKRCQPEVDEEVTVRDPALGIPKIEQHIQIDRLKLMLF